MSIRIIDAQMHEPPISLPWETADTALRREVLTEVALSYIDAAGVDAVVLFPQDYEWAADMARRYPDRVASVFRANHVAEEPDVEEQIAAAKRAHSTGVLAWRVVIGMPLTGEEVNRYKAGVFDRIFAACEAERLPLFFFATRHLYAVAEVAERYPDLDLIVDHLGLPQPPLDKRDTPPFRNLAALIALAEYPNVSVKFCGAPSLSEVPYPHGDIWPYLHQIIGAFGCDRLMWGSDISRFDGRVGFRNNPNAVSYAGKHSYAEALHYLLDTNEISATDKAAIFGGSLTRILGWPTTNLSGSKPG